MEQLLIYLIKSSGLIAVFYMAYHFLVRKETFFTSNRWFLIAGLFTSLLLPLFTIKKIIYVERPKVNVANMVAYNQSSGTTSSNVPAVEAFNWMQLIWVSYILIAVVLVIKIVFNFISLYRMLYQQQKIKNEQFTLVDLNHDIAPFSFFNYIVFNSNLYSQEELQSILSHEKIHSQEFHSFDVMVAKLFSIVFWFNPFVWLYKKAIIQNLEYIADQKAVAQLQDPKVYQRALLKVVTNQNCLAITNNFYQSLIKKRIVMLNKNQSQKKNLFKYALIIPALIGFVLLFQIKTIAQEKEESTLAKRIHSGDEIRVVVDKNSSEEELKKEAKRLKDEHGITLKYSKVKRNSVGEIIAIKVEYKDKEGNKGVSQVDGKEPIKPIQFYKNDESVGFGSPREVRMFINRGNEDRLVEMAIEDSTRVADNFDFNFDFDIDTPLAPETPEAPEAAEAPEAPESPEGLNWGKNENSKIIIKKGNKKPLVIINGKVVEGDESLLSKKDMEELKNSIKMNDDGEDTQIIINGQDMAKIRSEALGNAKIQIKRMRPLMKKNMEKVKVEMERIRPEMEKARRDQEQARPDMEKAKAEMMQAKEEMLKAKAEMDAARAELEKAKAELKKSK